MSAQLLFRRTCSFLLLVNWDLKLPLHSSQGEEGWQYGRVQWAGEKMHVVCRVQMEQNKPEALWGPTVDERFALLIFWGPGYISHGYCCQGLPGGASGKEPACQCRRLRDSSSVPEWRRFPGGGNGNPLQNSCLENPHGQRSLAGYSPWGHKQWDKTDLACALLSRTTAPPNPGE